ncbi:hypothetical protein C2G38_2046015 [Gigaspora rosea]|uniref:Uncharacterized protein n=1 Tax=Gigaspora rosea TaxID=44941 RepID=A0A397UEC0_9GLOM|nr:hypothetical protein C2G38_2046015 [Gigaspora rosea]
MPNIGEWTDFSPAKLEKLKKKEIQKPNPQVSQHSIPKSRGLSHCDTDQLIVVCNIKSIVILKAYEEFLFTLGWALKENQKFGKKGAGYFLVGNANKSEKYSAEKMWKELMELVKIGNLKESDIPKVSTIQNWIARYVAQHKQKIAQKVF